MKSTQRVCSDSSSASEMSAGADFASCSSAQRVFRQRPLHSKVRVQVTVRDVMQHLSHGPSAGPVRCIEFPIVAARREITKSAWRALDRVDLFFTLRCAETRLQSFEATDRVL